MKLTGIPVRKAQVEDFCFDIKNKSLFVIQNIDVNTKENLVSFNSFVVDFFTKEYFCIDRIFKKQIDKFIEIDFVENTLNKGLFFKCPSCEYIIEDKLNFSEYKDQHSENIKIYCNECNFEQELLCVDFNKKKYNFLLRK